MARPYPPALLEIENKRKAALKKIPEALAKQKKKFLIAINKNSDGDDFSSEDEQFVKKVMQDFTPSFCAVVSRFYLSFIWDDTKGVNLVQSTLAEHGLFELPTYLICAKIVFLTYSGSEVSANQFPKAAEYVLTHARQFGQPSTALFEIDVKRAPVQKKDLESQPLPQSKFMKIIEELIQDLRSAYDERKYRTLNVNATYITLLMLRRIVKKETEFVKSLKRVQTHDMYVKLCPWPLDSQLPNCDTSKLDKARGELTSCAYLAIQAYLNTEDERTKRVLRVTCIQYMEWTGLQLPSLFFKVVDLYQIDEGKLWDLLSCEITANSLVRLADDYYAQYEILKKDPSRTHRWFPYCRVLQGDYHRDLSAPVNDRICTILAYLVDLQIGFDKSTVRLSHWVNSFSIHKEKCKQIASVTPKNEWG